MYKSKVIQIILFCFGLTIFVFTYYSFFQNKNPTFSNDSSQSIERDEKLEKLATVDTSTSSVIDNLSYKNIDYKGNVFTINAETTKIFSKQKEKNFMKTVVARIFLIDGKVIKVYSDNAIYNMNNYNTKFFGNVVVVESENKITSNNLDFFFDKNLITIYNDVKYKGYNKFLVADKVDINLLDQKMNIYMNDKMNRVKINLKN
jgi:lipopolysaccharide export system protein LptA